ncbi:FMN-linked oxidoreductase [Suhomyces tanzawaensis NRRL Y-17324]|uniref:FMN-linked oxidoreductase n=1 Tax=Suhomyces tanzawaensis NRRL Y-17324 TaxID=984487 RepID=A0A1E4SSN0_9ASCO|nr:FMN-linked oxidoreductase [Suhomyces tanzawaensis NRRL Y-17324]ODV82402.1 FMN-linked oxidoreductase [Suhomyces tanzawaensis NRRL Y-17324]
MVNFVGKLCLAPMVRSGEIATRLLALKHGADLVWTPEYVDKKIIQTTRVQNSAINTVDYVVEQTHQAKGGKESTTSQKVVFRTHPPSESGKLIFQLGTSDPELAVLAASKVIQDVDGIDLNCGCPKPFSTHSGMGAALLYTPDLLCSILSALVEKVGVPNKKTISCKIRLLDDYDATYNLISRICDTGIANLTIHCRTRLMRNREDPIWKYLTRLIPYVQSRGISVVLNGNLQSRLDFENLQKVFNDQVGGMIAECAEANASVFGKPEPDQKDTKLPLIAKDVIAQYYSIAKIYNYDALANTKFMILNKTPGKSNYYKRFSQLKSLEDFDNVMEDLSADSEDVLMNKIYTKDLQKQKLLTPDEYVDFMEKRYEMMKKLVGDKEEPKAADSTKRKEAPVFSDKAKQQKTVIST